ncbi:universal stress protein [Halobaculum gomorrense]|uniref:Nucleotide-binding universal stress protein, UspA family n=1 Tax=Halobaculum gomorrense TaxID=43928 RepID=A0A1M5KQS8_9EURY|nr:universal stress protein [Halobaculum gomorrense]SHG55137.1 Nucleotide-binding universal stress protein, UspA family [Halobaculum gomorrense]
MTDRILIGVDDSTQAREALSFAADEWSDADLVLLTVIDPAEAGHAPSAGIPSGAEQWYERRKSEADALLAEAADSLEVGGAVETATTVGKPAAAIVEYAADHDVDHIIVGSHGRSGISRIVLGSVAEAVVRNSPVPVTVVR